MNEAQIIDLIRQALTEVAPGRDFTDLAEETKIETLGLDSIATMEMVGFLEDKTDMTFPDEELATVQSLTDLARLIRAAA